MTELLNNKQQCNIRVGVELLHAERILCHCLSRQILCPVAHDASTRGIQEKYGRLVPLYTVRAQE